jgi:hypothetical protein
MPLCGKQNQPHSHTGSALRLPPPLVLTDGGVAAAPSSPSPAGLKHHRRALLDVGYQQLPYNNYYYYNPRGGGFLGYFVPYNPGGAAVARAVAESNAVAVGPGATANALSEANAVAKNVGGRRRLRDYDGYYFPGRGHAYGRFFGNGGGQAVAQSLSNAQSVALGAGAQSNAVALSNAQAQNAPGGGWVLGGNGGNGGQAVAQSLSNAQSVALGPGAVSNAVALSNAQAQNLGKRRLAGTPPAASPNGGNDGEYKSGSYTSDDGKARAAWLVARSSDGASTFAASSASSVGP